MMQQVSLNVTAELANLVNQKGFAEIFVRTVQGRCSAIAKCAVAVSPDRSGDIVNIASHAVSNLGLSEKGLSTFSNDIIRQIDPQGIRRGLANLSMRQVQNTALLKDMASNVSSIYSTVSCIQSLSWLTASLSVVNLGATVISTVIICKKLDAISRKLDVISKQLESIDKNVRSIKHVQYEREIAKPCRDLIKQQKKILYALDNEEDVNEKELSEKIDAFCSQIESIYNLRAEYDLNDVLLLLYDLLPVYTNMIIRYYQHFYTPEKPRYVLHEDWMSIYEKLSSKGFRNEVRDYYFIEERVHNKELNQIVDCQYLVTLGLKYKIEQVLADLALCDSAEKYRQIDRFSEQYALQQEKAMKTEMKETFGEEETERMLEPMKMVFMQADAS